MTDTTEKISHLVFFVNGKKIVEKEPNPEWTLLYYLRTKLYLTGTKLGCAEGGCGACTVMVSKYNRNDKKIIHISVNACLAPLCSMHGLAVTTVEGIGSTKTRLHPVQERLANSHGSQCGFCTPGIIMSMYTLLRNNPLPSVGEMERAFEGNLCRCTGYRPILEGFRTLAKACPMGEQCCKKIKSTATEESEEGVRRKLMSEKEFAPYDPSQEMIFPSELQLDSSYDSSYLVFRSPRLTWFRPTTLQELLNLKAQYPDAKIVTGNTEVGIEVKFKSQHYPIIITPTNIPEMTRCGRSDSGLCFGGAVTLSEMEELMKEVIEEQPAHRTRVYTAVIDMLRWFAGHQVRNVAALAGNIMTASPISDLNPLWLAAGCVVTVMSKNGGSREITMDGDFFCGYRCTAVKAEEVLLNITVPFTEENEYFYGYKQAHRRDDDIAIVNAGMKVAFEPGTDVVQNLSLSYGGMAPTTVMATKTMKALIGQHWQDSIISRACEVLAEDLPLPPGVPGGSESYRRTLTTSFFFKFYLTVLRQLDADKILPNKFNVKDTSATALYHRDPSKGSQVFNEVTPGQLDVDPVGRPVVHRSALKQATGEARYCDDIPPYQNEMYLSLVLSTKAHAKIISVDASEALNLPGVIDYICHTDIPGSNVTGHIDLDEEVMASDTVTCQGHVIGAVLAEDQNTAQRAAKLVKIQYEELKPIITIEQAIEAKSYIGSSRNLIDGDVEAGFDQSDHIIEGEVRVGGQEHFYLETQACIAVPCGEDGEMDVILSTQAPSQTQHLIAKALGVPSNRIVCRTKRIGGGFGGKESRHTLLAIPVAIAANKHNRPVRCMLDRDEDMVITGTRHPFLGRYKVGFNKSGKVLSVAVDLYSNAGNSKDLSLAVLDRAIFHSDNCYKIPNIRISGHLCKTNIPSNTAFRGFGGPQGLFVCEAWMTHIANYLGLQQNQIRSLNMYNEGERTHFSQQLNNCNIRCCWEQVEINSDYKRRQIDVEDFNRENRWKKRGLAMSPVKFGIAFTASFLNQAGALVHVYTDGSVLLTHGGVEMGQGLHTKMIQVASRVLGVPVDLIHISETATNTVPNTSPTAASVGSDINGMAVMNACQVIKERLEPYMTDKPKADWKDWVTAAYFDRVSLSSTGFYKTPDLSYDWDTMQGTPFSYFTFGAACSEVEIDCLTGDHTVLRTDIVMDVGQSLNPAVDIGQIEGAFVQGYGLFTLEEQRYSPDGFLYTRGPGAYKIPGFSDIPVEFNVSLLHGASNPKAVYSSKAIGEPPLFLASTAFFAIQDAISAARRDTGINGHFTLHSPATAERIRMTCQDQFTKQFPEAEAGTYKPWNVLL